MRLDKYLGKNSYFGTKRYLFGISRSTYYMIKKGQYDHLLPDDYKRMKSITLTLDLYDDNGDSY
ncbi:hypothetical protein [Facilibium subflavum]|uniref:hypothetical protein n=1 Tax=Facilibium subflavum TaxID=2219058 RepID=UPI001AADBF73|nr:hypothetical protein [Facilibium subflavum]